jgi:3-dehydroquinate dehydratase
MAKKQGTSKSQAVRDYHKAHPKATNKEISEALTKAGIPVSPNHVANIKTKTKTRRKAARAVVSRRGLGIPEVKAALALLKVCEGSMAGVNAALAAAQEIRELV